MYRFASSMKKTPGSPVAHAPWMIRSKISFASSVPTTSPVRGVFSSYSSPLRTASMNESVIATLMLKFVTCVTSLLHVMKSRMSGWSTRRIPMFAPRRVPPCFTTSVEPSYSFMKLTGPLATPMVLFTMSSFGRSRLKLKPVPPPD